MMPNQLERGTSILQTALLIPLIFSVTLSIVDYSRFLIYETILGKAANDAVNQAQKISNFDLDVRNLNLDDSHFYDFYEARRRIAETAVKSALVGFFTDPETPSTAQLLMFDTQDLQLGEKTPLGTPPRSAIPTMARPVAIVRPGEYVLRENRDDLGNVISTSLISNRMRGPSAGDVLPPQAMQDLLSDFPIQVILQAKVRTFCPRLLCPWMPVEKVVEGTAMGYRELGIPPSPLPPPSGEELAGSLTATTSTVTTSTLGIVTTTTEGPSGGWPLALEWTQTNHNSRNVVWCPGPTPISTPIPCAKAQL